MPIYKAKTFLNMMQFNLLIFSYITCLFDIIHVKSLPNPKSQKYSPVPSSKNFMLCVIKFESMIHFELIFM